MKTRKRSRLLAGLLVLVMVITLMPTAAFAADPAANAVTATKVEVSNASDITAGQYLIYGISANTIDSKSGAFMSANGSTDTRLMSADITVTSGTASTADKNCIWNLIETTGGFYVQNAQTGRYLYYGSNSGNNIYQTSDAANAGVWVVFKNSNGWTLQETASMRELSCNRFGSAGSYYFGFAAYGSTSSTQRTLEFYKVAEDPYSDIDKKYSVYEKVSSLTEGDTVLVYNAGSSVALSSEPVATYYLAGAEMTPNSDGYLTAEPADASATQWVVGKDTDGNWTFTQGDKMLSSYASGSYKNISTSADNNTGWILDVCNADNCSYYVYSAKTAGSYGNVYIEWYAAKNDFTVYDAGPSKLNEAAFGMTFYKLVREGVAEEETVGLPDEGDQVVIYNQNAQGVLAAENDSQSIENAPTTISDGKAVPGNGGVVFTVEKNGEYWRFKNDTYGYLCSNGTGNNAFYSKDFSEEGVTADDADWLVRTCSGGAGGYEMESRTAKYNDKYSQWLEYYADSYKTYSMYNVTDYTIYSFYFYPVAEGVSLSGGVVNIPAVSFNAPDAYVGQDYTLTFTVDAVFGVQELTVKLGDETLQATEADGIYTVVIPQEKVAGDKLSVTVSGKDTKDAVISGSVEIAVKDEPVITDVTPKTGSETGDNKKPEISAVIVNAGADPKVEMKVNDTAVEAAYADGKVSYTPAEDMADGRVNVTVTVTRSDGKTAEKSWNFTVGEAQYQLYYGQLHSHTGEYSDGSGTLQQALEYVKGLPESANVDFVAFTDHSNYFDASGNANPEDALYDMSKATAQSQEKWAKYKSDVAAFNEENAGSLVAVAGFEMTWSGGPGHINTFNTPGIVSRNNSTLNNKTDDAGMKAYYSLLSRAEGADSLSQLNHPGSTFGTFSDFNYWDAVIDSRVFLVEVGNGEGQIGAGGYYPSYEYYTMALDKGWHVAPSNNQDNHKGKWGNANDARDVILTDNFTEEGVYDAIRAMRVYSTEDKNLELYYTVNGMQLGSSITDVPDKLDISVQVSDPDSSDSISKVEVIVNSGKTIYTWSDPAELAKGDLSVTLDPDYSYYYIRVTEGDGDLAVTAPVWVGESLKLGISSVECGTSTPVTGEELELTTTIFNSEKTEAVIKSVTYTANGSQVIGTQTDAVTVGASENKTLSFKYTPDKAKVMKVTVTVVLEQDGKEYTFSKDIELDVLNADDLVYIGIDAAHYNEYVAGNYKDSMGNFGNLAAGYSVRTVELKTSADLIAACSNDKYKALILTAPSRRLAAAQSDPRTYSADEINAIVAFNKAGGTVILAGWSDNYENYSVIQDNDAVKHMAATQNELLAALGSSLRISDDATYDDVRSAADGVDKWRLYFNTYGDSFLTSGVEVDAEHPYDRLYTEVFSHYGGASVYAVDANGDPTATLPSTVSPVVYGHSSTYSVDVDKDGLGGDSTPKYAYADGDDRLMAMASEQLSGQGLIIVSGAAFMSNFEVQATISDNGSEKNYSNYKICENLVQYINPVKVTDIATVQKQTEVGVKYTIEGVVTSNASGYDKDTAFFDCIYIQDETAGICCFPVAGDYKIGDKVRITGSTDFYQGEMELQVTSIQKIGEGSVTAKNVTAAQINDGSVLGSLVTVNGTVVSFELENGLIQTIMVKDAAGNTARVFIDGYITKDNEVKDLAVGKTVSVTGLASYDNTFNAPDGPFPRIRVRDRADVVVGTMAADPFTDISTSGYYKYIVEAANAGIIAGYPDGTYRPNNVVTRAQFITMLYRAAGSPEVKNSELEFADADTIAKPYVTAVAWGVENKVISGYGDNTFRPDQNISRAQMATFMYRYMKDVAGYDFGDVKPCGFEDANQIAAPYVDAVNAIVSAGVMNGMDAKTFAPNNTANRGMAATVILRVHNLTA
ncbi:MAG: S-layer homology domain-containing protein [Oscillospiraceae bacterium]